MRGNTYVVEDAASVAALRPFLRQGDAVIGADPKRSDVARIERLPASAASEESTADVREVMVTSLDDLAWAYARHVELTEGHERLLLCVDDSDAMALALALDVPFGIAPEVLHSSQAVYDVLRYQCCVRHARCEVRPFGEMILALTSGAPLLPSELTVRDGGQVYECGRRLGHIREGDMALKRRALYEHPCADDCEYAPFCPVRIGPSGCGLRERCFPFLEGLFAGSGQRPEPQRDQGSWLAACQAHSGAVVLHLAGGNGALADIEPFLRIDDCLVIEQDGKRRVQVARLDGWNDILPPLREDQEAVPPPTADVVALLAQGQDLRALGLRHPATSFVVKPGGELQRTDGEGRIGTLAEDGLPSRDQVDEIMAGDLLKSDTCSFCEYWPVCGGLLVPPGCQEHHSRLATLQEAVRRHTNPRPFRATVFTSFTCPNNCIFCAPANKRRQRPLTREEILAFIDHAGQQRCESISFSGAGEPTGHPDDLLAYARRARRAGIREITVLSNGSGLDDDLVARLVANGVTHFLVSLHGNEEAHDRNVRRRGSFTEAIAAIRQVTAARLPLTVNTCITGHNLECLDEVLDIVGRINPRVRHTLTFPEISGNACHNLDQIPSLSQASQAVMALHRLGRKLWVEGLPVCLLPGFPRERIVLRDSSRILYKDNLSDRYRPRGVYPSRCSACQHKEGCDGIEAGYFRLQGGADEVGMA